jgi:hypothetical protein
LFQKGSKAQLPFTPHHRETGFLFIHVFNLQASVSAPFLDFLRRLAVAVVRPIPIKIDMI